MKFIGRGHELTRTEAYLADLQIGIDMLADYGSDLITFKRILCQHTASTARIKLLARLEKAKQRTLKVGIRLQTTQNAKQNSCVAVVSASVHNALVLRGELHTRHLADRQSINIGTQDHASLVITTTTLYTGQHTRSGYRSMLDAQRVQLSGNKLSSTMLLKRELGMTM
jgi:hypothetical protein